MSFGSVLGNIVQDSRAGEAFEVGVMTKNNITSADRKTVIFVFVAKELKKIKRTSRNGLTLYMSSFYQGIITIKWLCSF